jgi:hypothetical protein
MERLTHFLSFDCLAHRLTHMHQSLIWQLIVDINDLMGGLSSEILAADLRIILAKWQDFHHGPGYKSFLYCTKGISRMASADVQQVHMQAAS